MNYLMFLTLILFGISCEQGIKYQPQQTVQKTTTEKKSQNATIDEVVGEVPEDKEEEEEALPPAPVVDTGPALGTFSLAYDTVKPAVAGTYTPNHLQAVWITTANDVHLVTLSANPGRRPVHLRSWRVQNGAGVDGFTGATVAAYSQNNQLAWDLKDKAGNQVEYGNYKVWFELTESNTVDGVQNGAPGYVVHQVPFALTSKGINITNDLHPSFPGIKVNFLPQ